MSDKVKNYVVVAVFLLITVGFMLANIIVPDQDISVSERRKLETFPKATLENVMSAKFFSDFETYALDQFVLRDSFRSIKAMSKFYLFGQTDNNNIYLIDDAIYKMNPVYQEKAVENAATLYKRLAGSLFSKANVYYTIAPDKNYFAAKEHGYLAIDYDALLSTMQNTIGDSLTYIDILDCLDINDYYRTDLHWDQADILDVANRLIDRMQSGAPIQLSDYEVKELYPFKGSYYGQAALPFKPDTLRYLVNDTLKNCVVVNREDQINHLQDKDYQVPTLGVYATDRFGGTDSYDVFLHGACALLTIDNPANTSGKQLFVIRDSFGSSLTPLLVQNYSRVVVIDLRYVMHAALPGVLSAVGIKVNPDDDVLFMYNTEMLNASSAFVQ